MLGLGKRESGLRWIVNDPFSLVFCQGNEKFIVVSIAVKKKEQNKNKKEDDWEVLSDEEYVLVIF